MFGSAARSSTALRFGIVAASCFVVWLVAHRLHYVWSNSVNVLFWDQWDLYMPMFREQGAWDLFNYRHGPHRQGLGSLLTAAMAHWSNWDVRYDSIASLVAMILAGALGVDIARRGGVHPVLALVLVPMLALTTRQYELWVGPSNPAHSPLPVLLTLSYVWCWFIERRWLRLGAQVVLIAVLTFTGFGIFAGAIGSGLLVVEAWSCWRAADYRGMAAVLVAGVLTAGAWALFFHGYIMDAAEPNFRFPHSRPWEYAYFIVMMFASFGGWKNPIAFGFPLGSALLLAVGIAGVIHGRRLLRPGGLRNRTSVIIFALAAATLLFCLNTAVGRIGLGWRAGGYPSRYVAMLMPGLLAVLLASRELPRPWLRAGAAGFLLFIAGWKGLLPSSGDQRAVDGFRRCRETWRQVMLETGSKDAADQASSAVNGYPIYPGDIRERLIYLRERRLNLYSETPGQPVQ